MKRKNLVDALSALLLIFFVHTSISIYFQLQSFKNMLAFYTLHTSLLAWLSLFVVVLISVMLFIPVARLAGFIATIIFAVFSIIIMRLYPHAPHDFGGLVNSIAEWQKYVLYSVLVAFATIGIVMSPTKRIFKEAPEASPLYT